MAHYYSKTEWENIKRISRSTATRQEPKLPSVKKRRLTLQPFSLVRNILPQRNIPGIIVKGRWLEQAGFNINDTVTVIVRDKKLVIQRNDN